MKKLFLVLVVMGELLVSGMAPAVTVAPSPAPKLQFLSNTGAVLSGGKVYTYEPGSTTPKSTYTDSTGGTANANPVVLDSAGRANIWIDGCVKFVVKTSADVTLYTTDNVCEYALSDPTISQWQSSGFTPTYVSATSFSVPGDQTGTLEAGTRIKTANTAGTIYSTITASSYSSVTTVTVVNDSGSLDSGLSTLDISFLTVSNPALPVQPVAAKTGDYVVTAADHGKTITFNKATAVTATLPQSSVNKTFTVTIASPAVFSAVGHGFSIGDMVRFTTTGALPTGLSAGISYYIISAGFTVDAFEVSTTLGGSAVNTSGSQSGTHTVYKDTAAVPGGWTATIKNIGAGALTLTGTVDGIVDGTLGQNDEIKLWSNGTRFYGKRVSATPAANAVPVSDSSGDIALGWIPDTLTGKTAANLAMTGEASATGTTTTTTLDLGTVTVGDRIFISGWSQFSHTALPTAYSGQLSKSSGTATFVVFDSRTAANYALNYDTAASGNKYGIGTIIIKVTGSGTLVMQNVISITGGTPTSYVNELYAFFLKKQ